MNNKVIKFVRKQLSRFKFIVGLEPIVEVNSDACFFVRQPFRAVFLLSADFEAAWAARYDKSFDRPLLKALKFAERERQNVPAILDISSRYNTPITWATVGHLFLSECEPVNGTKHPEIPPVPPYKGPFWNFSGGDWFEHDPCTDYKTDPLWYAPDLIRLILQSEVKHEIGCHTFSHIDCRDSVCPPELMRAELRECKRLAAQWGLKLTSFVHPGHTIGNLDVLAQEGFTNFRTDYRNVLGYPKLHANGLWELEQTAEIVYRPEWSIDYHIRRYITIIKRAIRSKTVCVFWFHPSFDTVVVEKILPTVFQFVDEHRDEIWVTTHGDYVNWLNEQIKKTY